LNVWPENGEWTSKSVMKHNPKTEKIWEMQGWGYTRSQQSLNYLLMN